MLPYIMDIRVIFYVVGRMMSRCFIWFSNSGLGEPNTYTRIWFELQCVGSYLEVFLGGCKMITKQKLDLGIHFSSRRGR